MNNGGEPSAIATGSLGLAFRHRLAQRAFSPFFNQLDIALDIGRIEGMLPDHTRRSFGGKGEGPIAQVSLHKWRALARLMLFGSVGWYQAWEKGEWSSPDPVPLFELIMRNRASAGKLARAKQWANLLSRASHLLRRNSVSRARKNIAAHYDLGNDFYARWLDPTMTYSSAMFDDPITPAEPLESAQRRKMAHAITSLNLRGPSDVLEIGCGWGALSRDLASAGHSVTGLTLSQAQLEYARARASQFTVPPGYFLRDYREETGQFDAIISIEMVEAVGQAYWDVFLSAIARLLRPGGRAVIQYISIAEDVFENYARGVDFIQAYIFPGGMLLSETRFLDAARRNGLYPGIPSHFAPDYAETLKRWRRNLDDAVNSPEWPARYDRNFIDLWRYYLMYCEGGFRGGGISVAQLVLQKPN